jgi:hypothetical protein
MTTSSRKQRGPRMVKRSTGRCAESTRVPPQCPYPPRAGPRLHLCLDVLGHSFTLPPCAGPRLHLASMCWATASPRLHAAAPPDCQSDRSKPAPFLHVRFPRTRRLAQRRNLSSSGPSLCGSRLQPRQTFARPFALWVVASATTNLRPVFRFVGRGFSHDKSSSGLSLCGSWLQPRQSFVRPLALWVVASTATNLRPVFRFVGRGFSRDNPNLPRKGASAPEGIALWNSPRQ